MPSVEASAMPWSVLEGTAAFRAVGCWMALSCWRSVLADSVEKGWCSTIATRSVGVTLSVRRTGEISGGMPSAE